MSKQALAVSHVVAPHPRYKDYPKHDLRRYFALLLAIERLKDRATMHYLAIELACTRGEVDRAVCSIRQNLMVSIEKSGFAYRITSWGVLSKQAVKRCMEEEYLARRAQQPTQKGQKGTSHVEP